MKKASEIYNGKEYWWDYTPMLEEFGDILLREDDEGWQGDSFLIYHNDNKYGYLSFGWGSCSGCDATFTLSRAIRYWLWHCGVPTKIAFWGIRGD